MLTNLVAYARQEGIEAEEGFTPKTARWLILLNSKGKFIGINDLADPEVKRSRGRTFDKAPHLKFSGDTPMRQFLVDTAHYVLLFGVDKPDEKMLIKHEFFLNLLREAASADRVFGMIADAISDEDIRQEICEVLSDPEKKAKSPDNVTFAITSKDGQPRILVEEDVWHDWWRGHFPTLFDRKSDGDEASMLCLVTGEETQPARTHPKVKGLGGVGGRVDTTLISFNEDAFCSYGLEQSCNAALSQEAAQQYVAALNALIERGETMAGTKVLYWYVGDKKIPHEDDPLKLLLHGCDFGDAEVVEENDEQSTLSPRDIAQLANKAKKMLTAIRSGNRPDLAKARYNALTISGNSARVVIRDWMEGQFEELVENVDYWFECLSLGNVGGTSIVKTPELERLITSLLPDKKPGQSYEKWIEPLGAVRNGMWKCAVRRPALPLMKSIAVRALRCLRHAMLSGEIAEALDPHSKDRPKRLASWYARIALLKTYCIVKGDKDVIPYLNINHENPAYHCGRFLTVCQHIQSLSIGEPKSSFLDRFYSSASATPSLTIPRIWKIALHHLKRIKTNSLKTDLSNLLCEIHGKFKDGIPKVLSLHEQSLFQLGFFQQQAHLPSANFQPKIKTKNGDKVRSKSELIVADCMYDDKISYVYEKTLTVEGIEYFSCVPDFTIEATNKRPTIYVEHLGMLDKSFYRHRWDQKENIYRELLILPLSEGGGRNGILVTSTEEDIQDLDGFKLRLEQAINLECSN